MTLNYAHGGPYENVHVYSVPEKDLHNAYHWTFGPVKLDFFVDRTDFYWTDKNCLFLFKKM